MHAQRSFLPFFVKAQTNRLANVLEQVGGDLGMREALGDQWPQYERYAKQRYYSEWLRYFMRGENKVIECVGPIVLGQRVAPCRCIPAVSIDMAQPPFEVTAELAGIHMDHTIPKSAICKKWRESIAARERACGTKLASFKDGCNIDYVNYLLFSVTEDPVWGLSMVRPRCCGLRSHHEQRCHLTGIEHAMRLRNSLHLLDVNILSPDHGIAPLLFGVRV